MAKWPNLKFKTWLKEIEPASLSQEKLKNEAIKFSKEFVEVDKKTIAKVVDDFEIEHKQVVADVLHSVFEEMGGEEGKRRGRRDVPPKNYFPQDENMLKIFQNETNLEKKCVKCNTLLSSRIEVKNHIQMNHEEELKKAFSKEAMSLVPFHNSYLSWLQKDHIVNALASRCCKDRNKVDLKRSNENVDDTYFKMIKNQNTADDLIETQRTIIVSQKDGTEKKKVLKYQLANVTTRPRSPIDEESKESCKRKNNEAERKQAKKVTNILDHISGNTFFWCYLGRRSQHDIIFRVSFRSSLLGRVVLNVVVVLPGHVVLLGHVVSSQLGLIIFSTQLFLHERVEVHL